MFQGFMQAKSANGGSISSSTQFFDTAPAATKNEDCFKSGQSWLENNPLWYLRSKSLKLTVEQMRKNRQL